MRGLPTLKRATIFLCLAMALSSQSVQCAPRLEQREELPAEPERNDRVELLLSLARNSFALSKQAAFLRLPELAQESMGMVCNYLDQALSLEPHKLDLYFSAAAAQIFNNNLPRALSYYKKGLQIAPRHQELLIYLAAYSHCTDDIPAYNHYLSHLSSLNQSLANLLQLLIQDVVEEYQRPIRYKLEPGTPPPEVIIVLGQRVKPDGSLPESLAKRIAPTLEVAQIFPQARIITSGGKTSWIKSEARQMASWLIERGVAKERITMEEYSRNTIENAYYCLDILAKDNLTKILIISSDNHIRRGCLDFRIAARLSGRIGLHFNGLAVEGAPKGGASHDEQKLGLYRDALQLFGLAHFRSYPFTMN